VELNGVTVIVTSVFLLTLGLGVLGALLPLVVLLLLLHLEAEVDDHQRGGLYFPELSSLVDWHSERPDEVDPVINRQSHELPEVGV
jgi:hypothetical protein